MDAEEILLHHRKQVKEVRPGPVLGELAQAWRRALAGDAPDVHHLVIGVVVHLRLGMGRQLLDEPRGGLLGQRPFARVAEVLEAREAHVVGPRIVVGIVHQEAPQVDPRGGGGLDVQVNRIALRGQLDGPHRGLLHRDPVGQHVGPLGGQAQSVLGAGTVLHFGQVGGQQLFDVGAGQVGDRGDAHRAQHRDLVHVEASLVDAQAQVVVVQLRLAGHPPGA